MFEPPYGFGYPVTPEPERRRPRYEAAPPLGSHRSLRRMYANLVQMSEDYEHYVRLVKAIQLGILAVAGQQGNSVSRSLEERNTILNEGYSWSASLATVEYVPRHDKVMAVAPGSLLVSDMRGRLVRKVASDFGRSAIEVQKDYLHIDIPEIGRGLVGSTRSKATPDPIGGAQVAVTLSPHHELREPFTGPQAVTTYDGLELFISRFQLLKPQDE